MKNIVSGFIAIGLLTLVGCKKDDDTDTTDSDDKSNQVYYGKSHPSIYVRAVRAF